MISGRRSSPSAYRYPLRDAARLRSLKMADSLGLNPIHRTDGFAVLVMAVADDPA